MRDKRKKHAMDRRMREELGETDKVDLYLNELSKEYRELLLSKLVEESGNIKDLSVSKLLLIDEPIKRQLIESSKVKKRKKTFWTLSFVYSLLACLFLTFGPVLLGKTYQSIYIVALVLCAIGVICSTIYMWMALSNKRIEKNRETTQKTSAEYSIVSTWRELEGVVNDIYGKDSYIGGSRVLKLLVENKLISDQELNSLRQLLSMRNDIVHKGAEEFDIEEMQKVRNECQRIISNIVRR